MYRENPAVPNSLLKDIQEWKLEGASDKYVIVRLRQRTMPHGYSYHSLKTWYGKNAHYTRMLPTIRGAGIGPADPATAGPKLKQLRRVFHFNGLERLLNGLLSSYQLRCSFLAK